MELIHSPGRWWRWYNKIMPVKKYRTFQEAEEDLWNMNPDEAWVKRVFRLFRVMRLRKRFPVKRGITKYRTIEEAERDRARTG